jgi:hypothetical protein
MHEQDLNLKLCRICGKFHYMSATFFFSLTKRQNTEKPCFSTITDDVRCTTENVRIKWKEMNFSTRFSFVLPYSLQLFSLFVNSQYFWDFVCFNSTFINKCQNIKYVQQKYYENFIKKTIINNIPCHKFS